MTDVKLENVGKWTSEVELGDGADNDIVYYSLSLKDGRKVVFAINYKEHKKRLLGMVLKYGEEITMLEEKGCDRGIVEGTSA